MGQLADAGLDHLDKHLVLGTLAERSHRGHQHPSVLSLADGPEHMVQVVGAVKGVWFTEHPGVRQALEHGGDQGRSTATRVEEECNFFALKYLPSSVHDCEEMVQRDEDESVGHVELVHR